MPKPPDVLDLAVDLNGGVVPISKAASSLAGLIKRSQERRQPIVITQKGYPSGVLLPIDLYVALRERAEQAEGEPATAASDALPPPAPIEAQTPAPETPPSEPPASPPASGGRKASVLRPKNWPVRYVRILPPGGPDEDQPVQRRADHQDP